MSKFNMSPAGKIRESNPSRFWNRFTLRFARLPVLLRLRSPNYCPRCHADLTTQLLYRRWRVCEDCGFHFPITAHARINHLVDPRSFREFSSPRQRHGKKTRQRKAIIAGIAHLERRPIVLVAFDFQVLGGTMSIAVGEEITRALEFAAEHNLPFVVTTATGGVRIQEGIPALMQMAKTTQAVQQFQRGKQPFIALLTHPTTGGVYASFANLADIILAEPGAVIGFAGPRVAEALTREKLPAESHHAETAFANGMIDAIVRRMDLRQTLTHILNTTQTQSLVEPSTWEFAQADIRARPVDEITALSRRADRPTALNYITHFCSDFVELHGDRLHGDDPAIVGGLAKFENQPIVIIAQERGHGDEHRHGSARPEGYRKAERLIHLAERFRLPIVTLVDTPGADPGFESEQHGIAGAIAHCLAALLETTVPTVSVIIGEGTSGGALAFAVTDRVLMMENATFAVISPEGASTILYGDTTHAAETAKTLGITASILLQQRMIDEIIPEPGNGARAEWEPALDAVKKILHVHLAQLLAESDADRLTKRRERYRQIGS